MGQCCSTADEVSLEIATADVEVVHVEKCFLSHDWEAADETQSLDDRRRRLIERIQKALDKGVQ
eukprot:1384605-Prymnesium_polylepis.1